ncbi:MAG: hypothetical protein OXE55_01045 [Flavobacteriaceae bacterium]|nr:hypothetical protein [Flavobacteriaceae bacterium]MCY4253629.1 hypothetical protein [Flavobacteriaceae bacterium]
MCPKKHRLRLAKQVVLESLYASAFVRPKKAKMTSLILHDINTQMMILFLEPIAKDFNGCPIIMPVAKARCLQSKD